MGSTSTIEQEKQEVARVMESGIFDRAPSQALVFSYLCSKYLAGETANLKEYTIAIEALGKPATFDHKRDSIIRVEMHQLRKRLKDYYSKDGAKSPIQISIPAGQYVPVFTRSDLAPAPADGAGAKGAGEPAVAAPAVETPVSTETSSVLSAPPDRVAPASFWKRRWILGLVALLAMIAIGVFFALQSHVNKAAAESRSEIPNLPSSTQGEIRIMAGLEQGSYVDGFGRLWDRDQFFTGGRVFHDSRHPISGTRDPILYQNRREGPSRYDIPLQPGVYEVRLHFSDNVYGEGNAGGGGETSRLFHVFINGKEVLHQFDVVGNAGPSTACIMTFKDIRPADDGQLHLQLEQNTSDPFINAIEITPGLSGRLRPIRMVARDRGYTGQNGSYWLPDRFAIGGQLVTRNEVVTNTDTPGLYTGERFGNFSYRIPVAQGRYRLTLYFAEQWFGPGKPAGSGAGKRVFDVLANGVTLLSNFDIYQRANGPEKALKLVFHDLRASPQGLLNIAFIPRVNYACVNAVEVEDESGEGW